MRFSLRTLMLLFPALIVAYGLSYGCASVNSRHWGHHPVWLNQIQPLKFAQEELQKANDPISVSEINRWFHGTPFPNAVKERHWQSMFYDNKRDGWEQPIVCVALDEHGNPDPLVEKAKRVGFYSCGEDGTSKTDGNDPDDLNSWNSTTEYYEKLSRQRYAEHLRSKALWQLPWSFGFVLICWAGIVGIKRWLEPEPMDIQKYIDAI